MRLILNLLMFSLLPVPASAHIGHLGEVAGHSHWVALGAGLIAAALAASLAKKKLNAEPEEASDESEEETELEPAEA